MCAISGVVGQFPNQRLVQAMLDIQRRRGPDGEGIWKNSGACLGHRRLKILDLSDGARQPMCSASGRYIIVFNGEIYNYRKLREELAGISFRTSSDTEVLVEAYEKWGGDCVHRIEGMFAFALWDKKNKELFCARDPLGIKPFYYIKFRDHFIFSSEIPPLLECRMDRKVNERALYLFLAKDFYDHSDETFFEGINSLPAGSLLRTNGQKLKIEPYWDLCGAVEGCVVSKSETERMEEFARLSSAALKKSLQSDVPVGITVSGGLDSSFLLGQLEKDQTLSAITKTFHFYFADDQYSEKKYVEKLLMWHRKELVSTLIDPHDFVNQANELVRIQGEPFAGLPIYAYERCFEAARSHGVVVLMDGSGMDEVLGGYERFKPAHWADLRRRGMEPELYKEWEAEGIKSPEQIAVALKRMEVASAGEVSGGLGQDLTQSTQAGCLNFDFVQRNYRSAPCFARPFSDSLRNLMYRELRWTKLPRALRFRDRISMGHGCELRPPYLDSQLVAYCFALPATDRIYRGQSKSILRKVAGALIPPELSLTPKRSVQTPQREWFRNELKFWIYDTLESSRLWEMGWIDKKPAFHALDNYMNGVGENSFFVWQWVNISLWLSEFFEQTGSYLPNDR